MFLFNQIKSDDQPLRLLLVGVLVGLLVLAAGLWWVQVVNGSEYQSRFVSQSFRSVRVAAPRGRILDRNGIELANNRPSYDVSFYLEEMRKPFGAEYDARVKYATNALRIQREAKQKSLGRELTKEELKQFRLSLAQKEEIARQSRIVVANNFTTTLAQKLQMPLALNVKLFTNHYLRSRSQPFTITNDLQPAQVARFEEQFGSAPGVELEMRSVRQYPFGTTSAHLLGYGSLKREGESVDGEQSFYDYREPDFLGLVGIEGGMDEQLRGQAGENSVLVNYLGYRQSETVIQPTVPGNNVVLTVDARLQKAAAEALARGPEGSATRGAIVVMDVRSGDVLALVSSPVYNPSYWVTGFPPGEIDRLGDEKQKPEINRATYGNYFPGSIFKIVVGMAALEMGLNPEETFMVPPHPKLAGKGAYYIGRTPKKDQAAPGPYNFRRALAKSSNAYFVHAGRAPGVVEKIVELGRKLHFGERAGIPTRQESSGIFPTLSQTQKGWSDGDTANLCIGQARVAATPLQVAVMISAVANGGTVYWPRIVQRLESQDGISGSVPQPQYQAARVRDQLNLSARTVRVVHDAMLAETEDPEGTGHAVSGMPGFKVGGKTGTAQVADEQNEMVDQFTWFAGFGPWENPRYAVVVMIESGSSGGGTCAPVARKIFEAIQNLERPQPVAMNSNR